MWIGGDGLPESAWTPSASGHSALCWSQPAWSQTPCHRFSDQLGTLQNIYVHSGCVTYPQTASTLDGGAIGETFPPKLYLNQSRSSSCAWPSSLKRHLAVQIKKWGAVCTSAGEGHPPIFFLCRRALIGSSCSDSKGGGSRQGTAVVI